MFKVSIFFCAYMVYELSKMLVLHTIRREYLFESTLFTLIFNAKDIALIEL